MRPKISIIVPIYNSEKYLYRCIDSLLKQTFRDYEIILVNDGSTDNTSVIIDDYANKYDFIKVFHNKNMGAGASREFGISKASGHWVMFVDSDDTIPNNALDELIKIDNGKYDIISGIYHNLHNNTYFKHIKCGELSSLQYISALLNGETIDGPCGKIIKRELYTKYRTKTPKDIKQNEDMLMLISLSKHIGHVFMSNDIISYNYIYRNDSARAFCMPLESWIKLFKYLKDTLSATIDSYEVRRSFARYRLERMKYFNKYGYILDSKEKYYSEMLSETAEFKDDSEIKDMYLFLKYPYLQLLDYRYSKTKELLKGIIKKYILRKRSTRL